MADDLTAAGVPSVPVARKVARDMLDRYRVVNIRDDRAVIEAYSALRTTLAQLLDALDYQKGAS